MTAYYYFARGDANVTDPTQGDIQGSYQFYNFFRGRIGKTGEPFVDPTTGLPTSFTLSGDPQTGQGWLDGQLLPAGDRRIDPHQDLSSLNLAILKLLWLPK